ncbi:hypothetical protein ABBQ32_005885 [Trebouxia sp. C0010 RCD-2024]
MEGPCGQKQLEMLAMHAPVSGSPKSRQILLHAAVVVRHKQQPLNRCHNDCDCTCFHVKLAATVQRAPRHLVIRQFI